jgi:hypothetical protein
LRPGAGPGWQAAGPGEQTIRLLFDAPLSLRPIHFVLREDQHARTQEFALRWSPDSGQSYQQIVRQQFTFSPPSTTHEVEDYAVNLDGVTALEYTSSRTSMGSLSRHRWSDSICDRHKTQRMNEDADIRARRCSSARNAPLH